MRQEDSTWLPTAKKRKCLPLFKNNLALLISPFRSESKTQLPQKVILAPTVTQVMVWILPKSTATPRSKALRKILSTRNYFFSETKGFKVSISWWSVWRANEVRIWYFYGCLRKCRCVQCRCSVDVSTDVSCVGDGSIYIILIFELYEKVVKPHNIFLQTSRKPSRLVSQINWGVGGEASRQGLLSPL